MKDFRTAKEYKVIGRVEVILMVAIALIAFILIIWR